LRIGLGAKRAIALCFTILEASCDFVCLSLLARRRISHIRRAHWLHRWSRILLDRWDVNVACTGTMPATGMVASNHLSYMDVLLFSALGPCVFVSKSEVRRWPVFGILATAAGTIFVDRKRTRRAPEVNRQIENALRAGVVVVLFPEGTSSDGATILPFRSPLFEAAIRFGGMITPAHVSYRVAEGSAEEDICYWGDMSFAPHVLKLLCLDGISAKVRLGRGIQGQVDRKKAASLTRESVIGLAGPSRRTRPVQYTRQMPSVASSTR
jgi:1-acyl-sn-glycerol-3-phosphate acyltransferase